MISKEQYLMNIYKFRNFPQIPNLPSQTLSEPQSAPQCSAAVAPRSSPPPPRRVSRWPPPPRPATTAEALPPRSSTASPAPPAPSTRFALSARYGSYPLFFLLRSKGCSCSVSRRLVVADWIRGGGLQVLPEGAGFWVGGLPG